MAVTTAERKVDFWAFSLDRYGRPGVAELCLSLQDALGADVNILLLCLWAGQHGTTLRPEVIGNLVHGEASRWHRHVVIPLRQVRRAMKTFAEATDAWEIEAVRTRLKGVEIDSERVEQFALARSLAALGVVMKRDRARDVAACRAAAIANARAYVALVEASETQSHEGALLKLVDLTVN